MSGDVASMPSFTRSGRPRFSFSSSSSFGSTSTAFRVRSTAAIAGSLVSRRLEVLDLDRLELVGRLETQQLTPEAERCPQRTPDRWRAAEPVTLALEADVRVRHGVSLECGCDRLRLRRRNDLVVQTLQEQQRTRDAIGVRHGRPLDVDVLLLRPAADEILVV